MAATVRPYLLVERNEREKLYRGPYIDAYCQVWFPLAKLFQRRRLKYEKFKGRTSPIKFLHFVPFHQQIWPPTAILVSDWLLFKQIFSSETAWQNGAKLGRKHNGRTTDAK
jgi:hypothetical protein